MHVFGVQEYPERSHVGTRRTDTSKISSSEFFSPVPTSLSQIVLGILSKSYMFREVANQGKRKYLSGFFPGFFVICLTEDINEYAGSQEAIWML